MDEPRDDLLPDETPDALLDAIRDHPDWTDRQRADAFDRLIQRFDPDRLIAAIGGRLLDLSGHDGEAVLHLIDALGTPALFRELAEAMLGQPDLAADRAWEALSLLDEAGLLDSYPELAERWGELNEAMDDEGSLEQLAEQLEDEPDGVWVALQGLGAVEPDVRAQILSGLARRPAGPGLIDFLRLLAFAHDPATRAAALDVLGRQVGDEPRLASAWASIAAHHPDPAVAARARRRLGDGAEAALAVRAGRDREAPRLVRCLVTALDGRGRGYVVLGAERGGRWATAAFLCDVRGGVLEVIGQVGPDRRSADSLFEEFVGSPERDAVEGVPELALGLLAGGLSLCGERTTPALRLWVERTAGPAIRAQPFPGLLRDWDPSSLPPAEMPGRTRAVFDSCRGWVDDSDLTYDLAEEILLREGDVPPEPGRDAGAYRYLFEHRLLGRLELYRRMLFWMASFWQAAGDLGLARSAQALAWQLSDAQHAVPGHPFTQALATRSLAAAQANLRRGIDLRRPGERDRQGRTIWTG